jgi:hypothetical protein
MSALLAVAAREVVERRRLLPLAFAAGLLPVVLPWLGAPLDPATRTLLAAAVVFTFTVGTALLAGGSVIGRDLSERRLGFFFARPIPASSLWAGKMLGALVLTLATLVLTAVSFLWVPMPDLPPAVVPATTTALLGLVGLIGLAHAASIGYRSRSPWFVADLCLAVAAAVWAFHIVQVLRDEELPVPVNALLGLAVAALTVAGAAQFVVGRADARRGHAALSLTLWPLLLVGLAGAHARAVWLVNPVWTDLRSVELFGAAPAGTWVGAFGPVRGRDALWAFVADVASGRSLPIGGAYRSFAFSADGRRAMWVAERHGVERAAAVSVLDLAGSALAPRTFEVAWPHDPPIVVALSPDGRRAVALQKSEAIVLDLDDRASVRRTALPAGFTAQAAFVAPDRVRLFHMDEPTAAGRALRLLELALDASPLREIARISTRGRAWVRVSPDRSRLLVLDRPEDRPSLTLRDGNGALLSEITPGGSVRSEITPPGSTTRVTADFLSDGRIVVLQKDAAVGVRILSPDGTEERTLVLEGRWSGMVLGGEAAPGRMLVGLHAGLQTDSETVVVDLSTGRVVRRERGVMPLAAAWFYSRDAGTLRPAPGSLAARLVRGVDGRIVELDPDNGARRDVLARLSPRDGPPSAPAPAARAR